MATSFLSNSLRQRHLFHFNKLHIFSSQRQANYFIARVLLSSSTHQPNNLQVVKFVDGSVLTQHTAIGTKKVEQPSLPLNFFRFKRTTSYSHFAKQGKKDSWLKIVYTSFLGFMFVFLFLFNG